MKLSRTLFFVSMITLGLAAAELSAKADFEAIDTSAERLSDEAAWDAAGYEAALSLQAVVAKKKIPGRPPKGGSGYSSGSNNYYSDGSSGYTSGSNSYYSDGSSSYSSGSNTYYSGGTSSYTSGSNTYYSDGTSSYTSGSNTYYSDGTSCYTSGSNQYCS